MKLIAMGFSAAVLFVATAAVAQSQNFIGTWHQPVGPSGCRGGDAYEATFVFDREVNGYLNGSLTIACSNRSGQFKTTGRNLLHVSRAAN